MENRAIQLYNYHQWANSRVFEHLEQLPDEIYEQEVKSVFSSIAEVIIHIYRTDGMWLSVMSGDPFDETLTVIEQLKEKSDQKSLPQMQELYGGLADQYQSFFDEQGDLDEAISINHPKYGKLETPVAELVKHVVNHGTYHRGNITAMLRQQGQKGVTTDYIFYIYEMK